MLSAIAEVARAASCTMGVVDRAWHFCHKRFICDIEILTFSSSGYPVHPDGAVGGTRALGDVPEFTDTGCFIFNQDYGIPLHDFIQYSFIK